MEQSLFDFELAPAWLNKKELLNPKRAEIVRIETEKKPNKGMSYICHFRLESQGDRVCTLRIEQAQLIKKEQKNFVYLKAVKNEDDTFKLLMSFDGVAYV